MVSVTVAYEGGIDDALDRRVRRIAGFQSGVEQGSGSMLIPPFRRDFTFQFPAAWMRDVFLKGLPSNVVQLKEESMRQPSKHYNMQHPAVGAVVCPICHVNAGLPCVTTTKARRDGERTETHVTRVKLFEREQKAQDVRAGE